jgi:phosphatidylglycerophosphatase C
MTAPEQIDDTATPAQPRLVVAAFDFDGTLTHGGSVWPFLVAVGGRRRVLGAGVALIAQLATAAAFGGRYADEAKESLFRRVLGGRGADDVRCQGDAFGREHYRRHARADVRRRMEWHRSQGHRLLIVSASLETYLAVVGEELGVDAVVATRLAVADDGTLTGSYQERNCRGAEKIERVRQWITDADTRSSGTGKAAPYLYAYGNSKGDRRLLEGADLGIDVGRLGRLGSLRRFPRLSDITDELDNGHPG